MISSFYFLDHHKAQGTWHIFRSLHFLLRFVCFTIRYQVLVTNQKSYLPVQLGGYLGQIRVGLYSVGSCFYTSFVMYGQCTVIFIIPQLKSPAHQHLNIFLSILNGRLELSYDLICRPDVKTFMISLCLVGGSLKVLKLWIKSFLWRGHHIKCIGGSGKTLTTNLVYFSTNLGNWVILLWIRSVLSLYVPS